MVFLDVPQGRALAIILPSVTLIAHTTIFFTLEAMFAGSWGTSWCALYDLVAAAASGAGLLGAVKKRSVLISIYALVHAITLSIITLVLIANVLPPTIAHSIPIPTQLRYDEQFEKSMCRDLDDGFGWDPQWLAQCKSSFKTLSTGIVWIGLVMVSAQWWAVLNVWTWLKELKRKEANRMHGIVDIEKADAKQELRIS